MISFWYRLLRALGFKTPAVRTYHMEDELAYSLRVLAENEEISEQEVAAELLSDAVSRRGIYQETLRRWRALTPREQQVTELICQRYTTGEMAAHLRISEATVRCHVRNILRKFGVHSRTELNLLLADWKFLDGG
jgi:DNA-binding NarL/FixJ family response regulator